MVRPVAGESPEQVLVVRAASGAASSGGSGRRGRRRARAVAPEPPVASVPVTVATVIEAAPLAGGEEAEGWLARAAGDDAEATVRAALDVLRGAIHGHRVAAADPYVAEVGPDAALVTRVGYGSGEQVAEGHWTEARELGAIDPAVRGRHEAALRPQERLAALLGGRDAALACEELVLRGRLDLDSGREREAALQAHLALEAARVELAAWRGLTGMADRLSELDARRDAVAAAANAALQGGLPAGERAAVAEAIERIEAALRARSAAGQY